MRHSHFSDYLLAVPLRHALKVELLACKYLYNVAAVSARAVSGVAKRAHHAIAFPAYFADDTERARAYNV